ncbi:RPA family protein [Halovenus salina]|uniref:RPA family protein n=1 Tax=Halovenus salina TaxID=1510225 RepID=A0ABD5W9Q8_9EURY|nr:DNA-binding protein [Halovenus salina]
MSQQDQAPQRELAHRVFAREFNDATHTFRESDDDRAPVYALLPTGAKANRVFIVGTVTETNDVGSDDEYWQGRIVDPTGTVFVYAGQYQPDAAALLRELDPPAFVAVVGKPRTYDTDDGETNVSLRPEHITVVDEATRNRWVAETAQQTLDRLEAVNTPSGQYVELARQQYGSTVDPYRQAVIEAVESLDSVTDQQRPGDGADDPDTPATDPSDVTTSDAEAGSQEAENTDDDEPLGEFESDELGLDTTDPQS